MAMDAGKVERFSRGEAIEVEIPAIEKELAALWQAAGIAAKTETGERKAVSRAALWNMIIHVGSTDAFHGTKTLIDAMTPFVPARVIVLRHQQQTDGDSPELGATIESNVVSTPGGTRTISSEEITLIGHGPGVEHFAPLVRSLQAPGLPTALFWIDTPPTKGRLMRQLLVLCDRLIIDTGAARGEKELVSINQLVGLAHSQVADLGWLRLANFRLLFAGLFEPPVGGAPLLHATRVTVRHNPSRSPSALLLVGWLACQLGWTRPEARDGRRDLRRFRFQTPARAKVEVELCPDEGESGTSGIVAMELTAGEDTYAIHRTAGNHAELSIPIAPSRSVKLDSRPDVELCVGALGPRGHDALFPRALAFATELAELSEWTR